jgi:oxygen-independent coproporphyrinogen III oxidase
MFNMAGIYLHIPFCKKACHYCNFHFSTTLHHQSALVAAMQQELAMQRPLFNSSISTVYFGGGTPSILSPDQLQSLLQAVRQQANLAPNAEITLEANPDDMDVKKLHTWQQLGINRLSIGVQSFHAADLQWMNRAHNVQQAVDAIQLAQQVGITNISIDLIYGVPGLSDEQWLANLNKVTSLGVQHLSCYALTVEHKTALEKMIAQQKIADVDPEQQSRQFLLLMDWAAANGWEHYEISNFCQPGWRSRHNSSYWQGKPYWGIGPSAHSFDGQNTRQWNVANNALYIQQIEMGVLPAEQELLSPTQQLNEYIMTSLRTIEGIQFGEVMRRSDERVLWHLQQAVGKYINNGQMQQKNNSFVLTNQGKLFADGIAADLFVEDQS